MHNSFRRQKLQLLIATFGIAVAIWPSCTLAARGVRQDRQITEAAKFIKENITQVLIREHLATMTPISSQDQKAILKSIEETKAQQSQFTGEQLAYVYLAQGLVEYYRNGPTRAIEFIKKKTLPIASDNADVCETLIVLSMLSKDYATAREILASRDAGYMVVADEQKVADIPSVLAGKDPNSIGSGMLARPPVVVTTSDPNAKPTTTTPAKPVSRFSRDAPQKTDGRSGYRPGPGGMMPGAPGMHPPGMYPPGMGPTGRAGKKPKGGGATYTPGGGMFLPEPGMMMPGMGAGSSGKRGGGRKQLTKKISKGMLNLPVEYMIGKYLGQNIGTMQLSTINGSYFVFEPGKGQVFAVLLWTYDDQGQPGKTSRRSGGVTINGRSVPPPSGELSANADQFKMLFSDYLIKARATAQSGKIAFAAINIDKKPQIMTLAAESLVEQSWPWANCFAGDPRNLGQWPITKLQGAIFVLVGGDGKICYMGPVGGFLPQLLLTRELASAKPTLTTMIPTPNAMPVSGMGQRGSGGVLGWLMGSSAKGSHAVATPAGQTSKSGYKGKATKRKTTGTVIKAKKSNQQAQQMLRAANVQKRLTPRAAVKKCDEVIARFPNSLEADEAKLLIESILRNQKSLIKERKAQGKYVGKYAH